MIPYEVDLPSTPFCDTTIITYEIELPPSGKKTVINLLDDEYFTIPCVIDTIPNSPVGHQLPTQSNKNVWVIAINGEDPNTAQGALDELQNYQTRCVKYKFNISLCRRKSYQRTDIDEIWSIFDQVRSVVSHVEVILPRKPPTPKNIYEAPKGPRKNYVKKLYLCNTERTKISSLF